MKTFELVTKEIRKRNLSGQVAEVGVFRGEFAQYIHKAFHEKTCYLFDTFSGFDDTESDNEIKSENCTEAFSLAYKNTSIDIVLKKMDNPNQIVIKQGLFPDSLNGLEDEFCFVSIDVDFEKSIYDALVYFYPRLVAGGYIFVHDYTSSLQGVEKAVDDYENFHGSPLNKVPLCDTNGTIVITK